MNVSIEKVEIVAFGRLKNAVVDLKRGINVLSAPNESGKTTLASFIKFIFYGFAGGGKQTLSDNERKLYTPWDCDYSAGAVTLEADGTRYTVERRCLPSGKETVSVTDRSTGKAAFTGLVPGEVFFGVGEDVFARTLFFRQLTLPQSKDELLADRLSNIAISADEQINTGKAISRLNDAKNELKNRLGNGIIPQLQRRSDELGREITDSLQLRGEAEKVRARIEERAPTLETDRKKLAALNGERANIEKYEALVKLRNIERLKREEADAAAEYEKSAAMLKSLDGINSALRDLSAVNSEYVAEKTRAASAAEALNEAETARHKLEEQMPFGIAEAKEAGRELEKHSRTVYIFAAVAALFAIAGIIVLIAANKLVGVLLLGVAAAALGVAGAFIAKRAAVVHKLHFDSAAELKRELAALPQKEAELDALEDKLKSLREGYDKCFTRCANLKTRLDEGIGKYIDSDGGDYSEVLDTMLSLSTDCGQKRAVYNIKREEYERSLEGVDFDSLSQEANGAEKPAREKQEVDNELRFYTKQYEQLGELQRQDELSAASLESRSGDPAVLVGKKAACDSRIADLDIKYRAYEAAIAAINESGDYMKSMVAPRISARANEYFALATGGKYGGFEVDTKMSMSFGADFRRSCEYLSAGTRDSAYLSLRLALADMLFGGSGVPMILDDAFVRIDESRMSMMARALAEAAEKHQIIILTHGDREKDALREAGAGFAEPVIRIVE